MALIGVLLVAVVTARARHVHQLADAERKLNAIDLVDELITSWHSVGDADSGESSKSGIPRTSQGMLPGRSDLRWRTEVSLDRQDDAEALGVEIVRLTITSYQSPDAKPLMAIDLVIPGKRLDEPEVESP